MSSSSSSPVSGGSSGGWKVFRAPDRSRSYNSTTPLCCSESRFFYVPGGGGARLREISQRSTKFRSRVQIHARRERGAISQSRLVCTGQRSHACKYSAAPGLSPRDEAQSAGAARRRSTLGAGQEKNQGCVSLRIALPLISALLRCRTVAFHFRFFRARAMSNECLRRAHLLFWFILVQTRTGRRQRVFHLPSPILLSTTRSTIPVF